MSQLKFRSFVFQDLKIQIIWIVSFSLILSSNLSAEQHKVFRDQYLIEPGVLAASSTGVDNQLGQAGLVVLNKVGKTGLRLVKPQMAAQSSASDQVLNYDPQNDLCQELLKSGTAKTCSPNYELHADLVPNDSNFSELWGLSADKGIDAPGAWDVSTGSSNVVVGIIDTGIDYNHPELAENVWTNTGEIPGNGIDDDGNGYIDDVHGWNAVRHNGNPFDDNSHGTHVAGTIGAVGNNANGVVGVNWQVKIMALKFLDQNGSGSLAGAIEAIDYAVTMKSRGIDIRMTNNSWGGGGYSQALYQAIERANQAGIVFVAAAGNESSDNDATEAYPANYDLPNVISVAAIDDTQNLAYFSNYGATQVDIAAPGVNIKSTTPSNTYSTYSGTSMATPHVTGALALLLASEPALSNQELITRLYESGVDTDTLTGMVRTGRRLNVSRMLHNLTAPVPENPDSGGCSYAIQEISFNPNSEVKQSSIVLQADESQFYQANLPFSFPFQGKELTSVFVSPNGVVYADRAPVSMDFKNSKSAPRDSIAALHTDLTALHNPYGIRASSNANQVNFYWKAKHFSAANGADVEVWLTLYADGKIEEFLQFGDSQIASLVSSQATVGITGVSANYASTYASDNSLIRNHLALRYTPLCDGSVAPLATRVSVKAIEGKKLTNRAKIGQRLNISVSGRGSGSVSVQAILNKKVCSGVKSISLTDGSAKLSARVPGLPTSYSSLGFQISNASGKVALQRKKNDAKNSRIKTLNQACQSILNSIRE